MAVTLGGSADEIEARFYEALQTGDLEKLMGCWADDDEVVCVHPSGPRLLGLGAIRTAFDALLNQSGVRFFPEGVQKIESIASSVHSVHERLELMGPNGPVSALLMATNVYHKTTHGWRMVAHHASPGSPREIIDVTERPPVLH